MAITITDLNPIITPADSDVLVLDDISEGTTKHITFSNLRSSLLSQQAFTTNAANLVTALNAYDAGQGSNTLRATTLFHSNAYRDGAYFLNYDNFTNKPTIPSNLDQLTNNSGFVKLDTTLTPPRLVYYNNQGGGTPTPTYISTYNVPENSQTDQFGNKIGPLYYTDARVETFLDNNFATYYNQFTSTFDDGNVRDSLFGVPAVVYDTNLDSADYQGQILRITDTTVFDNFSVGQTIRIYGADLEDSVIAQTNASLATTRVGFDASGTGAHQIDISYRIAEFDISTGQIAPVGAIRSLTIATPARLLSVVDNVYQAFNTDNFVRLTIQGVTEGRGVLVYRRTPRSNDQFILTAVLGPKEVAEGQWIDYYDFDWVEWSGKEELENTYPASVIHFPRVASTVAKRGWVDMTISAKTFTGSNMNLTLNDVVYVSQDQNSVSIAHNDTQKIRLAIQQNSAIDRKSVVLNAKTYVASQIDLPNNFGVTGTAYITKIVKLPWSGGEAEASSAKMLKTSTTTGATNISIVGVDLEGNALNQFLFPDSTDSTRNYIVDLGINADGPLIDKVRIRNVIGGGIWADRPIDFRMSNSEVLNGGVSDRLLSSYSPLYAYAGQKTTITSNRFENFGEAVDVSNTNRGIVSDNLLNAVGSGLITAGSKFFISSQNVLVGAAGEFLPTLDTLNSEFDMINIDLSQAYMASADYISDNHVYQENGVIYDLSSANGNGRIDYDAKYVQKLPNGGEEFWTPTDVTALTFQPRALQDYNGQFGFTIPYSTVADIKSSLGTNSYTRLTQNTILWTNLAADINTIAGGGTLSESTLTTFLTGVVAGYARADVNQSGGLTSADATDVTNYGAGNYGALTTNKIYRIRSFIENALLDDASSATPLFSSTVLARYVRLGNPYHVGIIWRARFIHEVAVGPITQVITGTGPVSSGGNGLSTDATYYHILVRNPLPYLSVGSAVTLNNHGSSVDGIEGTVTAITTINNPSLQTADSTITIQYANAVASAGSNGQGTINIVDKFVLAQGRIL